MKTLVMILVQANYNYKGGSRAPTEAVSEITQQTAARRSMSTAGGRLVRYSDQVVVGRVSD
jgi:nitrous oxide reductase accessory protein NosL